MKNYNQGILKLNKKLSNILLDERKKDLFNVDDYLFYKKIAVNNYFIKNKIDVVILGISGGIDSAVSLGLLVEIKKMGQIKEIVPVLLPSLSSDGAVSKQDEATNDGIKICKFFKQKYKIMDLSQIQKKTESILVENDIHTSKFSNGQLVPNLRTSIQYYLSSTFADANKRSVVIGTINRTEGSYLGYMGKAGDSIADIQIISDLYKSQVYALSNEFKIPKEIITRVPTGDMFDLRSDEELFGVTYDSSELFLRSKNNQELKEKIQYDSLFNRISIRMEKLHNHNFHKYIGGSPSVHLDLYQTYIEYGMKNNLNYIKDVPLDPNKLVNFQSIEESKIPTFSSSTVLKDDEIDFLLKLIKNWIPVGIDGYKQKDDEIGSYRATVYSEKIAKELIKKLDIKNFVLKDNEVYRFHSLSPSLRFIKYETGGKLIPHYDFPYEYNKNKTTLFSVIFYLQVPHSGGETRFIKETRKKHEYKDWINCKNPFVLKTFIPLKGENLVFTHLTLHDGNEIKKGIKIIIRTDLIYEKIS